MKNITTSFIKIMIVLTSNYFSIQGFTKEFTSLSALVTHHSVMPELLPVPLLLARPTPSAGRTQRREHADIDAVAPHRHAPSHHVANFLAQLDV